VHTGGERWSSLERPPLDERALRRALRAGEPGSWWRTVRVVESTSSTNAALADAARDGAEEAALLVAEHQHAGRGRMGRAWQTPARAALTFSVLVRPPVPVADWPWLPLLTGVAVAEAMRRGAGLQATVKWPNDVLVDDRKLAGILLERVETPTGPAAVLGIGLNVSAQRQELPVPSATSLALEGAITLDRPSLLLSLVRTLEPLYREWVRGGRSAGGLHEAYLARCSTVDRQVRVELPDGSAMTGLAETVDAAGRLVVATAAGRRAVAAGDVVHVRPRPRNAAGDTPI
jgi:BirA family transcriptional regulator, biotin operon repressor / biotin---[acetyl-CoA-carboxylase] ligase